MTTLKQQPNATPIAQNVFDAKAYLDANPDVRAAGVDPYQHYVNYGLAEGRQASVLPQQTPITEYTAAQVQSPTLPQGTEFIPTLQQVQQNELLTGAGTQLNPSALAIAPGTPVAAPGTIQQTVAATPAPVTAAQGVSSTVDPNAVLSGFNPNAGQTTASYTQAIPDMVAEQGTVSKEATVQGQLEKLMDFDANNVPAWAKGALSKAQESMASRGLGASSIAAGAITAAIQQAALPIAAQDASSFFQMDITNLSNRQQTSLENTRMRQQNMLTDTAISNATKQFNAANAQQTEQFTASLVSSIAEQNAARKQAMEQMNVQQTNAVAMQNQSVEAATSQFNAGQANTIAAQNVANTMDINKFNAEQEFQRQQFNKTLENQRQQFNSQMQFAIEQSNVTWRRSINTQNTVAVNAANQANVQNAFNMSAVAQNNIWQQFRDEASWMFTASQNDADRAYNAAMAANNRQYASDTADKANDMNLMSALGSLGLKWALS